MPLLAWLLVGVAVLFAAALIYWTFIITEGSYLGAGVVSWTYDLAARRYDAIKQFNPLDDAWLLASPMVNMLREVSGPLVLDIATGTGRMPLALLKHSRFLGYVVALDLSQRMLQQAQRKLQPHCSRCVLLRHDAQRLPFPDETFDAVSCLEAIEFMPSPRRVLAEMSRVLRPGGVFLVTNRVNWERRLMPGKAFSSDDIRQLLESLGLSQVEIRPWQVYYDLIWARKEGQPSRLGYATRELGECLRCPACGATPLEEHLPAIRCPGCGRIYLTQDNVTDMTRPRR